MTNERHFEVVSRWVSQFLSPKRKLGYRSTGVGGGSGDDFLTLEVHRVGVTDKVCIAAVLKDGRPMLVAKTFSVSGEGREVFEWQDELRKQFPVGAQK